MYTGLDNLVTTAKPVNTQYLVTQFVTQTIFQTYNVPLTQIKPDSPVSIIWSLAQQGVLEVTYIQEQSQSIYYTGITSTFVSTINTQTSKIVSLRQF